MKTLFFLLILFSTSILFAQSTFSIEEGETFVIEKANAKMLVDEWIMKDNSIIIIADDVLEWEINANKSSFGNNCKIIASGRNGGNGASSNSHGRSSGECKDGGHGGVGGSGRNGESGKKIIITMGLMYVNDLYIDVSGGNGGNGGNGANGGKGGRASCGGLCSGQEGGNGGKGGRAGTGGNGGEVLVKYWIAGSSGISMGSDKGLRANVDGGLAGTPGNGGVGGPGGDSRRCPPFIKRSGGSRGHNGAIGDKAKTGIIGNVVFQVLPRP